MAIVSTDSPESELRARGPGASARRIVFVDDDELFLRSVERVLRRQANPDWSFAFVSDGPAALRELAVRKTDAIVIDAQMPQMSGLELLRHASDRHPDVIRILLSSNNGVDVVRHALPYAHQFLSKPCDSDFLASVLESACNLQALLGRGEMRELVASSNALPSTPRTYMELSQVLADPKSSSRSIANVVERDIAIASRVLQLVSSAFYGPSRSVTSIGGAVAFLGIEVIKAIVLSVEVSRMFPVSRSIPGFSIDGLQQHGLKVAQLAKRILGYDASSDLLLIAGMLQDVGQLVLAARAPQRFGIALSACQKSKTPLYESELELFGATHAEIGGYLLGLWALPERVVHAVSFHLEPQRSKSRRFDAATALYVANHLLRDPDVAALDQVPDRTIALDLDHLRKLGVAHQVDEWRRISREIASTPPERAAARA